MGRALDESPKHIELSPMNFARFGGAKIRVSFVSTDQIRHVYFSVRCLFSVATAIDIVTYKAGMHAPLVFFSAIR